MKLIKSLISLPVLALLLSFQAHADTDTESIYTVDEKTEQVAPATSQVGNQQQEPVLDQIEQQQEIVNERIIEDQQIVNEQINQDQQIVNEQIKPYEDTVTDLIIQDPQEADDALIKKAKLNRKIVNEQGQLNAPLAEEHLDKFSNSHH